MLAVGGLGGGRLVVQSGVSGKAGEDGVREEFVRTDVGPPDHVGDLLWEK